MEYLVYAIDRAADVCGSKVELADRLGFSPQRLNDYRSGLRHMPYGHVIALAAIAGISGSKLWADYSREYNATKKPRANDSSRRLGASSRTAFTYKRRQLQGT